MEIKMVNNSAKKEYAKEYNAGFMMPVLMSLKNGNETESHVLSDNQIEEDEISLEEYIAYKEYMSYRDEVSSAYCYPSCEMESH